jgi:hypothetical protein
MQSADPLSSNSQRVGNRNSYPASADVEAQNAP